VTPLLQCLESARATGDADAATPSSERPRALVRASSAASPADVRIVARSSGKRLVFIMASDVWAFEARGRLVFVHVPRGCFDIDLPLSEVEAILGPPFMRVHRNWLVAVSKVRELWPGSGTMRLFAGVAMSAESPDRRGIEVPVARDRVKQVRRLLLADALGLRFMPRG
jgi:DNA-binding LytR/AlgR family response regulator